MIKTDSRWPRLHSKVENGLSSPQTKIFLAVFKIGSLNFLEILKNTCCFSLPINLLLDTEKQKKSLFLKKLLQINR